MFSRIPRSRLLAAALVALAIGGCGSDEKESTSASSSALEGAYYSASSDSFRWIEFDGTRFLGVSPGPACEAAQPLASCVHRGSFTRDDANRMLVLVDEVTGRETRLPLEIAQVDGQGGSLVAKSLVSGETDLVGQSSSLVPRVTQFQLTEPSSNRLAEPTEKPIVVAGGKLATFYAICVLAVGQVLLGVPGADVPDPLPDRPQIVRVDDRRGCGSRK